MQATRILFVALLVGTVLFAQQPNKPKIGNVTILPSEPIVPSGDCKSSTAGYLEPNDQTADGLGKFVSKSLRNGYIVTVYPATARGIFVNMNCTNTLTTVAP